MKIVFSWDDGAKEDLKLFELHKKYNVPAMFFVPNYNKEGKDVLDPEMIREASSDLITFGGHTVSHSYLTTIPAENLDYELRVNKEYLEELTGKPIEHFCLPGGKYNDELLAAAYRHFKTVRTADTMNVIHEGLFCKPTFHFYPRGKKSLLVNALRNKNMKLFFDLMTNINKSYFELFYTVLRKNRKTDAVVVIWGHSWEIEELNLWDEVEKMLKCVSEEYRDCVASYDEIFS